MRGGDEHWIVLESFESQDRGDVARGREDCVKGVRARAIAHKFAMHVDQLVSQKVELIAASTVDAVARATAEKSPLAAERGYVGMSSGSPLHQKTTSRSVLSLGATSVPMLLLPVLSWAVRKSGT